MGCSLTALAAYRITAYTYEPRCEGCPHVAGYVWLHEQVPTMIHLIADTAVFLGGTGFVIVGLLALSRHQPNRWPRQGHGQTYFARYSQR